MKGQIGFDICFETAMTTASTSLTCFRVRANVLDTVLTFDPMSLQVQRLTGRLLDRTPKLIAAIARRERLSSSFALACARLATHRQRGSKLRVVVLRIEMLQSIADRMVGSPVVFTVCWCDSE